VYAKSLRVAAVLAVASAVLLQGCASVDSRDAPWDPRGAQTLMDQIPNEEGGARRICCGHLRQCKPYQSPRC
jgi:hypothetical protein